MVWPTEARRFQCWHLPKLSATTSRPTQEETTVVAQMRYNDLMFRAPNSQPYCGDCRSATHTPTTHTPSEGPSDSHSQSWLCIL